MFFKELAIGQYLPGTSLVHRLDPRAKLVITFAAGVSLFGMGFSAYAYFTAALVVVAMVARIPPVFLAKSVRPILFFLLITMLFQLFATPGTPIFSFGPLSASIEGANLALLMGARLLLLVVVASMLSLTTSPIEFTDGMESMLRPFRRIGVPAHELAMMMSIALRFIPTLTEEAERILRAQMARGANFDQGHVFRRAKAIIPILIPLFISAFQRAEDLALAMEARAYRGGEGRTRMRPLRWQTKDGACLGLALVFIFSLVWFL